MTEKTASKHLINLQSTFAVDNPILQNAVKIFHELDQFEYDLGLIKDDDTTAIQTSWWPIISVIGGNSGSKETFLARYLNVELLPTHKTTVLLHNLQANPTILPATALDVDYRYPFYRISHKIAQLQKGEGERLNAYLELKTINSPRLQGRLIIDIPNFIHATNFDVSNLLTTYGMQQSDVVLVFCDIFNSTTDLAKALTTTLVKEQESNKFVYLFDDTTANAATWQRKLADLGLTIGQFIGTSQLENQSSSDFILLEHRLANAGLQCSYRVLHSLEKSICDVEDVVIQEVKKAVFVWKERSTFSSLIVLGFISMVAVFGEVEMGLLQLLIDPIIGTAVLLMLIAFMVPLHVLFSKLQAKIIIHSLDKQKKRLHLIEDLAALFEQNVTFSRMMLPINEPVNWNKKTKAQLALLLDKAKTLVQSLNDNFNAYNTIVTPPQSHTAISLPSVITATSSVEPTIPTPVAPHVIEQSIPKPSVATTQATLPQRQSALMQKILRK